MKLKNGQLAKDFTVNDIYGNTIKLSSGKGSKTILTFFRNINCPFCNMRAHQMKTMHQKIIEKGIQLIWVFESSPEQLLKSVFHQSTSPIPLIGDPEHKLFKLYEIENSTSKMLKTYFAPGTFSTLKNAKQLNLPKEKDINATQNRIPADFLINKFLFIEEAYYGKHLNDHIPLDRIKSFAK